MDKIEILRKRHSVRTYQVKEITKNEAETLKAEVTMINTIEAGLHFKLLFNDQDPFKGFMKSYGTFVNARNYLAAVVDESFPYIWEKAGYYAEQFVIKATEIGIGSCFVGGTYDAKSVNVDLRKGQKILFVVVFGYEAEKQRSVEKMLVNFVHRKKMIPSDFFTPKDKLPVYEEKWPTLRIGLEAVACAPSALNKRPVRITIKQEDGKEIICAKVDEKNSKNLIDLGIAKYNYNYATDTGCEWGNGASLIRK